MGFLQSLLRPQSAPSLPARQAAIGDSPVAEGGWRKADPARLSGLDQRPIVSVVTVCFNSAKTIGDTIAGIRRQTYPAIEYIIVDGGSTDGTVDLLRRNEDIIAYWRSEPDGGIYDAFNKGIALARGDLIQIINSDDWMEPEQLERGVAALEAAPDADFVHGDIWLHGWRGQDVRIGGDPLWDRCVRRTMPTIHQATVLARRRVYEQVGLFRTDLRIASDYDWFIRVAKAGLRGQYDRSIVAHMRAGGASTSRQRQTIAEGFVCARSNGDRSLACAAHWARRWIAPNGRVSVRPRLAAMRRGLVEGLRRGRGALRNRALRAANTMPWIRRLPGRSLVKRIVGVDSGSPSPPASPKRASLTDFVAVRDLDGGLGDAAIERLLLEAPSLPPVALIGDAPIVRQAGQAIRLGGGSIVEVTDLEEAGRSACGAAVLEAGAAALQGWAGLRILLLVGPEGLRVERRRP